MQKKLEYPNTNSFKLSKQDLNDIVEIALKEVANGTKPYDLDPNLYLAQCWAIGVLSILTSRELIEITDKFKNLNNK